MVLPPQSWWLVEETGKGREDRLQRLAPWLFPKSFGFESVGRRFFWECEPEIPIPSIVEVQEILRAGERNIDWSKETKETLR